MPDDRTGRHTVGRHGRGHRDLHREDRGLDPVDTGHRLRCQHRLGDRKPGLGGDQWFEFSDHRGEHRLGGQQARAHRRPLRALAGEHPHRSTVILADRGLERIVTIGDRPQALHEGVAAMGCYRGAYRPMAAAAGQGMGQIAQNQFVAGSLNPVGQALRGPPKALGRRGRDRKHQLSRMHRRDRCAFDERFRGLLQHCVHIGTRHAVRGDRRTPRGDTGVDRPSGGFLRHEQTGFDLGQMLGQLIEVQVFGHHAVLNREHGFHQAQHTGSRLGVAEVALHRSQRTSTRGPVDGRHAGVLDGVSHRRAGSVCFNHADGRGVDIRGGQG